MKIEYALLTILIGGVMLFSVGTIGESVKNALGSINAPLAKVNYEQSIKFPEQ